MSEDKEMNQSEPVNKKDELLSAIAEMDVDMDRTITLTDEETGEDIEFIVNDTFSMNGKEYIVLLQPSEDPDADYEYVIMETVTVDGEEMLQTLTDKEADVDTEYGHNRIRIQGRTVVMMEADCPDGYCKEQNAIGAEGGSIICLPHHLVIEMVKENGETNTYDGVDAIAR